jgi:hypothetical protein
MKPGVVLTIVMLATAPHLLAQAKGADCIARQYKAIVLPLRPARINDSGQVAGTTKQHRAGLWSEQKGLRELPLPPASTPPKPSA